MTASDSGEQRVLFPPGTFSGPSRPASATRMLASQTRMELSLFLRNGEQLLLALVIPAAILVGLTVIDVGSIPEPRVDRAITAVLAIAVMSTAFTGQAIAVGFDRRYGALKRLGGTPLPRWVIIGGKSGAVLLLVLGQALILGGIAAALGWRPGLVGLVLVIPVLVLGTIAFSALGLLLGGTLRAEIVLALANLIWFVLLGVAALAVGLTELPGWGHGLLTVLPSYALATSIGAALAGGADTLANLVLLFWGVLCSAIAVRTFSFT